MKPLAHNIRPETIKDVLGQKHLLGDDAIITRMIEEQVCLSLILYGKPGIGKTTMAICIANELNKSYAIFNAATDNKQKLIEIINNGLIKIIIVEEVHRLNKDKQDILLPYLEKGRVTMFATTTENPYFVINPAIRSRSHVLELNQLTSSDIQEGLVNIIEKHKLPVIVQKNSLKMIADKSNGDFRFAINVLELIQLLYPNVKITPDKVKKLMPGMHFYSDKKGDGHYDLLSAFHKSLRGSDSDASLYYMTRIMLSGDLEGIYRRMMAVAYEDVGLASVNLPLRVKTAIDTVRQLGFPEGRLALSTAVIDVCLSPKSNSSMVAISKAVDLVENGGVYPIPKHLKDSHYKSAAKLNNGVGYKYPHNYKNNWTNQQYLPDEIKGTKFYEPQDNAYEKTMENNWDKLKSKK